MNREQIDIINGMSGVELEDMARRGVRLPREAEARLRAWHQTQAQRRDEWRLMEQIAYRERNRRPRHPGGRPARVSSVSCLLSSDSSSRRVA
jgi:hypothetical protein